MTTSVRNGNCKIAEFNADHLSQLLQETGAFVAMLENRGHGRYLVSHIEHQYRDDIEKDWFEVSIFFDYFLDAWEELDLNNETEKVDLGDEVFGVSA